MNFPIIRHDPGDHCGWLQAPLEASGYFPDYIRAASAAEYPPMGVLFLGGSASANDGSCAVTSGLRLIDRLLAAGAPILGICLGAQLIAKALGAEVRTNSAPEIGWLPLRMLPDAAADPLLEHFSAEETLFHWHHDVFDLPRGAVRLADSSLTPNQAFRYGANVWGLQFHPEVTPDLIDAWTTDAGREPFDHAPHLERARWLAEGIASRWIHWAESPARPGSRYPTWIPGCGVSRHAGFEIIGPFTRRPRGAR